jgi:voltage-gated potassium channel
LVRRQLQFFIIRQLLHLRDTLIAYREVAYQPLRLFGVLLGLRQIRFVLFVIVGVLLLGTLGYMSIANLGLVDAFYMTMITMTTVGFGEIGGDMNTTARLFTIMILLASVTVVAYGFSSLVQFVATGRLLTTVAEGQRQAMLKDVKNHFIVAGYGRVGQEVTMALRQEGVPFVVVEIDEAQVEKAQRDSCIVVSGTATEDENLLNAGIERAQGVICAAGSDATNVYIVLTARGLNPNLFIISRASDESSEAKLLRAGADRVISPYILSGRRMANLAVRPFVVDFLDVTGSTGEIEKTLEEIVVEEGSVIANRTIGEADLGKRTGALVLALYRSTGELMTNPHTETLLEAGTRMIVLGTRDALDVTEALSRNLMNLSES